MAEDLTRVLADLVGTKFDSLAKDMDRMSAQYVELRDRLDALSVGSGVHEARSEVSVIETLSAALSKKAESSAVERLEEKVGDLKDRMQLMDKMVDMKLEVISETAKKIQLLHDTITEAVVSSRHSAELERLRLQLQTLGGTAEVGREVRWSDVSRKKGFWSRLCSCERRMNPVERRLHHMDSFPPVDEKAAAGGKPLPGLAVHEKTPCDDPNADVLPQDILDAVLKIEQSCMSAVDVTDGLIVDRLVDEPNFKYCTCSAPDSQNIISCLWAVYEDISLDTVKHALLSAEERATWDSDAEFKICQRAKKDDPLCSEVIHFVLHAPWPFWHRDVLQRRCQLPLGKGAEEGSAIVMRSVSDDNVLPEHPSRVRAFVSKGAFLLRPHNGGRGLMLTSCSQLDIGGLVPQWAQNFLTRLAIQQAEAWKDKLREHCLTMASRAG